MMYFLLAVVFWLPPHVRSSEVETEQIRHYKEKIMMMSGPANGKLNDACAGADPKKAFYVAADGNLYCIFIPAASHKFYAKEQDFNIDAARLLCNGSDANLLQIHDPTMHLEIKRWAEKNTGTGDETGSETFHPLGIKEQLPYYDEPAPNALPTFVKHEVQVTWHNGQKTVFETDKIFDSKLALWLNAEVDGVTYLSLMTGSLITEEPEITKLVVSVLCHQDPDHPVTSGEPVDVCAGLVPEIKDHAKFFINEKAHCIFHPANVRALLLKNDDDEYDFELEDFIERCNVYNATLLQLPSAELYNAVLEAVKTIDEGAGTAYPLGIKEKIILSDDESLEPASMMVVTWDSGKDTVVMDSMAYEQVQWENFGGVTSFLSLPSGRVYTKDPKGIKGPIQVMCQQEWPLAEKQVETSPAPEITQPHVTTAAPVPTPPGEPPEATASRPDKQLMMTTSGCGIDNKAAGVVVIVATIIVPNFIVA